MNDKNKLNELDNITSRNILETDNIIDTSKSPNERLDPHKALGIKRIDNNGKKRKIALLLFVLFALILIALGATLFVVLKKPSDSGPPKYVDSSAKNSYYLDVSKNKITGVTWLEKPEKIIGLNPAPFKETKETQWEYYKVGFKNDNGTRSDFYISNMRGDELTVDTYFIGIKNAEVTIYTLLSPVEYDFASIYDEVAPYNLLSTEEYKSLINKDVIVDDSTVIEGTTPPLAIEINDLQLVFVGFTEFYRAFYEVYPESDENIQYKLLKTMDDGKLYELVYKGHLLKSAKTVQYVLYLNNRTKVLYKLVNNYNDVFIDNINWSDSTNKYRYVNDLNHEKCSDKKAMFGGSPEAVHEIFYGDPKGLKETGKYPDGSTIYTSDELNKEFFEYYKIMSKYGDSEIQKIDNYDNFIATNPTYLIDSSLGYYFVYYNIDLLHKRDTYPCTKP